MDQIIVGIMAFFMVIGAVDKALFDGKFGYGKEFENGLNTMGPLALVMVGIMCVSPALGTALGPALSSFFLSIGSDPALFPGILLGVDAWGLPLAQALAKHPEAVEIFGIGLCSTLACIICMPLPISLAMATQKSRPFIAKGIVAGIIASPLSMLGVAWVRGYDTLTVLTLGAPAFGIAVVLAFFLIVFREPTIRFFIGFGRVLVGIFALLLTAAALEHYFSITIIPGMAKFDPQLTIIGQIGVMLAGAYPMVLFIKRYGTKVLHLFARTMRIDDTAALGMLVSVANPLPMYAMIENMTNRGKVIASAFSGPVLCMLGDHLGFMAAYYPQCIEPLIAGKALAAVAAVFIALGLEVLSPSPEETAPAA